MLRNSDTAHLLVSQSLALTVLTYFSSHLLSFFLLTCGLDDHQACRISEHMGCQMMTAAHLKSCKMHKGSNQTIFSHRKLNHKKHKWEFEVPSTKQTSSLVCPAVQQWASSLPSWAPVCLWWVGQPVLRRRWQCTDPQVGSGWARQGQRSGSSAPGNGWWLCGGGLVNVKQGL